MIFEHILRYRITVPEILHRLYFDDSEPNAVTKVTSRLCKHGFLARHDFLSQRSYYTLGTEACKILGVSRKKTDALGSQALTTEFGTLAFCFQATPERYRLRVSDLQKRDETLLGKGLNSSHYYFDVTEEAQRLGMIRVEQGSTPSHIVRKCEHELNKRLAFPSFKNLIENDQFLIAIVTSTIQKHDQIHIQLRKKNWGIKFRIAVVPELIQLNARGRGV